MNGLCLFLLWEQEVPGSNPGAPTDLSTRPPTLLRMVSSYLPKQPVIRAILIFLVAFGVYATVVKILGGSDMGFGGGAAVGAVLAVLDYRRSVAARSL